MPDPVYETYPAVDADNNFPPVVREAMVNYAEFTAAFARLGAGTTGGLTIAIVDFIPDPPDAHTLYLTTGS